MTAALPRSADPVRGWQGRIRLQFRERDGRTIVAEREQRGPLLIQRTFHPEGDPCHVYLLHPPGGMVGGDRLEADLDVGESAHALVTTPGATMFYRSLGPVSHQVQKFAVADGGVLEWLPRENIVFDGAEGTITTRVDLDPDAAFIGWETACFGRPASGERFTRGTFRQEFQVCRDGRPLLLEKLALRGDRDIAVSTCGLRGHPVNATLVATPATRETLEAARDRIGDAADIAMTLVDGLLVARYLGPRSDIAQNLFREIWAAVRPLVTGRAPCPPRIWKT